MPFGHLSERHTYGKVESEVALEVWVCYGEMSVAVCVGRMDCFHATIESKDKVVEVEA